MAGYAFFPGAVNIGLNFGFQPPILHHNDILFQGHPLRNMKRLIDLDISDKIAIANYLYLRGLRASDDGTIMIYVQNYNSIRQKSIEATHYNSLGSYYNCPWPPVDENVIVKQWIKAVCARQARSFRCNFSLAVSTFLL